MGVIMEQSCLTAEMFILIWINCFCTHSEQVLPSIHTNPDYPCELVGTWNTWYGEQDQAGTYEFGFPYTALLFCIHHSNSLVIMIL